MWGDAAGDKQVMKKREMRCDLLHLTGWAGLRAALMVTTLDIASSSCES